MGGPVMLNPTADLLDPILEDALETPTLTHAAFIHQDRPAWTRPRCWGAASTSGRPS